jgi:hypothetical protein
MHKTSLILGLLALTACNREPTAFAPATLADPSTQGPGELTPEPTPVVHVLTIDGTVTDAVGPQGRIAGPGTIAATTRVQAVTLAGEVVAQADVTDGAYALGLETLPADALLTVQALNATDEVVGAVVVELTDAERLSATPLDVESSVEAAVLEDLLAASVDVGVWGEVRHRVDSEVARVVLAETDPEEALAHMSVAVRASWEAHVDAWEAAGLSVDTIAAAQLEAATALSASLAAGDAQATATFDAALYDAALTEGLSVDAALEAEAIAAASLRTAIQAVQASDAVALETIRASALLESTKVQDAVVAETSAMFVSDGTVTTIQTAMDDLEAAVQAATTLEEVELAVQAWRDTVMGAIEAEITAGQSLLDQLLAILTDALAQLEAAIVQLETAIDGVITAAGGVVDAAVLAGDVATAYADQATAVAADLEDLDDAAAADAMATVNLAFPGL